MEKGCRKIRFGEKRCRKGRCEKRVPERDVWKKGAGKRGFEKGCSKARFRRVVPKVRFGRRVLECEV